jgi:predicted nucleic acid-binding protein
MSAELAPAPLNLALDTNVVLDWLFFQDPSCRALDEAARAGTVRWIGTLAMHEELERVLTREPFMRWPDKIAALRSAVQDMLHMSDSAPPAQGAAGHCTDPDDQKFIDLVMHLGAPAQLISRDRAVLRLARAASRHGVTIVSIADWCPPAASGG